MRAKQKAARSKPVTKVPVLDRLKAIDEQRQSLLDEAKAEALARAQSAVDELNGLGFPFKLIEGGKSNRKGTRSVKDAPCELCGFKTNPPHDKRSHRTQPEKKPFTEDELKAKGMVRV